MFFFIFFNEIFPGLVHLGTQLYLFVIHILVSLK